MNTIGLSALITIISQLFFIFLAFLAINGLNLERFLPMQEFWSRLFVVFLSIAIGFAVSSFFISFIENIKNLTLLF